MKKLIMLEGNHDYQFIKYLVKNKYSEKDISTYNFSNANKNKAETNFLRNFIQDTRYNTKKMAIKIEDGKYNLLKLMTKSLPLIVQAMEQLQLIYITDLDNKEPFDMINKMNDDFKARGNTYKFKIGKQLINCDHIYASKIQGVNNNKNVYADNIIFIFFKVSLEDELPSFENNIPDNDELSLFINNKEHLPIKKILNDSDN
ncbi:hypothetical protein [Ferroplasma acidarmanus]|nr:hypothetical protein [Ferroplasma acidarmanus]